MTSSPPAISIPLLVEEEVVMVALIQHSQQHSDYRASQAFRFLPSWSSFPPSDDGVHEEGRRRAYRERDVAGAWSPRENFSKLCCWRRVEVALALYVTPPSWFSSQPYRIPPQLICAQGLQPNLDNPQPPPPESLHPSSSGLSYLR
ncbi:hypothetical protein Fcan01_18519 [Folsomia candida]|uniref:Uncharacterized protein n=1 Tax=Folsomia candida TaxID=158441 RepID=A0A226DMM5_FOLCA|nr:hypothetical protein Fcan01_18519 [Folsomia candida]